jgi:hypothetical protein
MFENLKSAEKKIEHKTKCTIVFYYRHSNGESRTVSKKMQTCNRAMVIVVPDEEVTT